MRALLLVALVGFGSSAQGQDFSAVDALIEDSLSQIGGGAALLVLEDGDVVHRAGYGTFSPDAVRLTASAAKWISGSVIASLLSDGTLTLDDSLAMFFPGLEGDKRRITVRQLFAHTSGIRGSREAEEAETCISDRSLTLAECADQILAIPLVAEPGTEFRYGGNSMQVAGRVAEIASGETWDALFTTRIARPLRFRRTEYLGDNNPRIAGGMVTTIDEYGALLHMLLDGGIANGQRVLSEDAVAAMLTDQTNGARIVETPFDNYDGYPGLPPSDAIGYGIGVWGERIDTDGTFLEASSQGAFGLSPWIDVERRVAGVLLVQSRLSEVMGTYLEAKRLIRLALNQTPTSTPDTSPSGLALEGVAPSPLRRWGRVTYTLDQPSEIGLRVVDLRGRTVIVLEDGPKASGEHHARLDASDLAAGRYVLILETGARRVTRPITVVR